VVVVVVVPPPCPPPLPGAAVVVVTATDEVVVSHGCFGFAHWAAGAAGAAVTSSGTLTLPIATKRRPATIACKRIRNRIRRLCTLED